MRWEARGKVVVKTREVRNLGDQDKTMIEASSTRRKQTVTVTYSKAGE